MIRLARPHVPRRALRDVAAVLRSGALVQGPWVERLEAAVSKELDVDHVVAVSSGTAALHLALVVLGIGPGDEVVVPAFSFPATANVVELVGAQPIFVDISLDDFCLNTELLTSALSSRTKLIMPVNEFGLSADMDSVLKVARKKSIPVVEDAACSFGAKYRGRPSGTLGLMGCFSFHPRKIITSGEGGAIATNDAELARKLRLLRNHGIALVKGKRDFVLPGFNYRMTEFQAALMLPQIETLQAQLAKRQKQADTYARLLEGVEWLRLPVSYPERLATWQTFHALVTKGSRDRVIGELKKQGIETNLGAQAIHQTQFYKRKYKLKRGQYLQAAKAFEQGLALPLGEHLSLRDLHTVARALRSCESA